MSKIGDAACDLVVVIADAAKHLIDSGKTSETLLAIVACYLLYCIRDLISQYNKDKAQNTLITFVKDTVGKSLSDIHGDVKKLADAVADFVQNKPR